MGLFEVQKREITLPIDLMPGYFGGVGRVFVLPTTPLKAGTTLSLEPLPVTSMLRSHKALVNGEQVGYGFSSAFKVTNHGGYLLVRKEGTTRPESFSVVLRLPELIICDFANAGALAISPKISTAVSNIFMEQ